MISRAHKDSAAFAVVAHGSILGQTCPVAAPGHRPYPSQTVEGTWTKS